MKNEDVVKDFIKFGVNDNMRTENLFIEHGVLFSYGYHFPLCVRLLDGFIINKNGYSQTTACHKGIVVRELTNEDNFNDLKKNKGKYPNIILMETDEIHAFKRELEIQNQMFSEVTTDFVNKILMCKELNTDVKID